MSRLLAALALALLAGSSAALACGEGLAQPTRQIEDAQFLLMYRTAPDPLRVGRHFSIDFALCPRGQVAAPDTVRVDAHMPEHRHGMNYQPSVAALGRIVTIVDVSAPTASRIVTVTSVGDWTVAASSVTVFPGSDSTTGTTNASAGVAPCCPACARARIPASTLR